MPARFKALRGVSVQAIIEVDGPPSVTTLPASRDWEKNMEDFTPVLRAYGVALAALFATHPRPDQLRRAFESMAHTALMPDPMYAQTLETLRKSIP